MNQLRAFHADPKIKATYLNRVLAHRAADEIVQGTYWENGRGCAVGCTIHSSNHSAYEKELGIPRKLARLQDRIFEGLPLSEAKDFPQAFLDAIPVGADLNQVADKFIFWLLGGDQTGEMIFKHPKALEMVAAVRELYRRKIAGEDIPLETWIAAREAGWTVRRQLWDEVDVARERARAARRARELNSSRAAVAVAVAAAAVAAVAAAVAVAAAADAAVAAADAVAADAADAAVAVAVAAAVAAADAVAADAADAVAVAAAVAAVAAARRGAYRLMATKLLALLAETATTAAK